MIEFLRQIKHFLIRGLSSVVRMFVPIKKGRVLCSSFGGLQYTCNPKYISEAILNSRPEYFQLIWSFAYPNSINGIDEGIKKVRRGSLKELFYICTSEFLISNVRLNDFGWGWKKRPGQKYIMTWHGSMALKRVEFDALEHLPETYMEKAARDSENIDLMLSDSRWCTLFTRRAFHYNGEVLECGLPRNDIFFQTDKVIMACQNVRNYYNISEGKKVLLYAPTFRVDKSTDNYIFVWDSVLKALKNRFGQEFVILVRLHPNMATFVDTKPLMTSIHCIDATHYSDMQELLCAADVLITDYSSTMFEFALRNMPCFLYVPDKDTYDRGSYFRLEELPFPQSSDIGTLVKQIQEFDEGKYQKGVDLMFTETFGAFQQPNSSFEVVKWMFKQSQRHIFVL